MLTKNYIYIIMFVFLMAFTGHKTKAQSDVIASKYPVIPSPQSINYGNKEISFSLFKIHGHSFLTEQELLNDFLSERIKNTSTKKGINIIFSKETIKTHNSNEAYELKIDSTIHIKANTNKGVFYAIQTLKQLTRFNNGFAILPQISIKDYPAFKIRGFMHDTGRNFQPIEQLKEQIEILAQFKYNIFHWHLTENEAWRLESKKYPQLNSNKVTERGKGKFYSHQDFKEIIAFCKARNIIVIPEFDIPGHSRAFRKAFGFQSMNDKNVVPTLQHLFDELCNLASAEDMPYIHIGTDEVRTPKEQMYSKSIKNIIDSLQIKHKRQIIKWQKGITIKNDGSSIQQLWALHKPEKGHQFIDSRANYINHLDPFSGMVRLFYQQPCRQSKSNNIALGGILCAWPDNNISTPNDILQQNPIYPAIVFYSDAIWKGKSKNYPKYWSNLPNSATKEFSDFKKFEKKVLILKRLFFKNKPFQYLKQTDKEWKIFGPYKNNDSISTSNIESSVLSNKAIDTTSYKSIKQVGATIHFKHFFGFKALTKEKTGTFYAYTNIYSPNNRHQDFWIGFHGWSRSGGRRGGPTPKQGQWHHTIPKIWINSIEIKPPVWRQPNIPITSENIPFIDEDYFYRVPTKVKLQKGWNSVLLKIPHTHNSWKWMFTCTPVRIEKNIITEVNDLIFSTKKEE